MTHNNRDFTGLIKLLTMTFTVRRINISSILHTDMILTENLC